MMKTHRLSQVAGALVIALGLSTSALAEDTSSGVRGVITTPQGQPAADTKVIITHLPSGTKKTVTTNSLGSFQAKGLRVGGPYKVTIDSEQFQDQEFNDIFLNLGEVERLNTQLQPDQVETIVVTGRAIGYDATGSRSSFGLEDINRAPSFDRDLKDIVRNNPLAVLDADGNLSIGGQNTRFNSITVDGIGQNDDFGLNAGGYPTQRSPISLDAIAQVSIDNSPFSSRVGGFSGGLVNAVTKSGTNEFHGSVFYEFQKR